MEKQREITKATLKYKRLEWSKDAILRTIEEINNKLYLLCRVKIDDDFSETIMSEIRNDIDRSGDADYFHTIDFLLKK